MKLRRSVHPLRGPLDMTALIDVVLLLMIFFILSSTFVTQPGIQVNPPRGLTDGGVRDARFILNITAQDPPLMFLNDQLVQTTALDREFRRIARDQHDATLVLRADRAVSHGEVTRIMSQALQAGLFVLIATLPEPVDPVTPADPEPAAP